MDYNTYWDSAQDDLSDGCIKLVINMKHHELLILGGGLLGRLNVRSLLFMSPLINFVQAGLIKLCV